VASGVVRRRRRRWRATVPYRTGTRGNLAQRLAGGALLVERARLRDERSRADRPDVQCVVWRAGGMRKGVAGRRPGLAR
jgi:hypothetical protein